MSDVLAEQLKKDVSGFEAQVTGLLGRKESLNQELGQIDADIKQIEPLYNYARNLLGSGTIQTVAPITSRTAAATAASAEARRKKAEEKKNPVIDVPLA